MDVLGIDVGKRDLHAVLLQGKRSASKSVPNSGAGIGQLQTWLTNRKIGRLHVCLEATGGWSEEVAIALNEAGHVVSLVNPARIKAFAQSELTDRFVQGSLRLSGMNCAALTLAAWMSTTTSSTAPSTTTGRCARR